jgi:hypothetical protein
MHPTAASSKSSRGRTVSSRSTHAVGLAILTALFFCRVAGQAIQRWLPQSWLPPFEAFQGSGLPYPVLLSAQIAILAVMLRVGWQLRSGAVSPNARVGRTLAWLGGVYMAGSCLRIVVGLVLPEAPRWFIAWIPALFHLVLAGFVLVIADYHLRERKPVR